MPEQKADDGSEGGESRLFDSACRELALHAGRTPPAERHADVELVRKWLQATHSFALEPFSGVMVAADPSEPGEDSV